METEIRESDAFTAKKERLVARFTSDYRFQKNDEVYIHSAGGNRPLKVRLIDVRVHVQEGGKLTREILALKV